MAKGRKKNKQARSRSGATDSTDGRTDTGSASPELTRPTAAQQSAATEKEWTRRKTVARLSSPMENSFTLVNDPAGNHLLGVRGWIDREGAAHSILSYMPNSDGSVLAPGEQSSMLQKFNYRRAELDAQAFSGDFLDLSPIVREAFYDSLTSCADCQYIKKCTHTETRQWVSWSLPMTRLQGYARLTDLALDIKTYAAIRTKLESIQAVPPPGGTLSEHQVLLRKAAAQSLALHCRSKGSRVRELSEAWSKSLTDHYAAVFDYLYDLDVAVTASVSAPAQDDQTADSTDIDHDAETAPPTVARVVVRTLGSRKIEDVLHPDAAPVELGKLELPDAARLPSDLVPFIMQSPAAARVIPDSTITMSLPSSRPSVLFSAGVKLDSTLPENSGLVGLYIDNSNAQLTPKQSRQTQRINHFLSSEEWAITAKKEIALTYDNWPKFTDFVKDMKVEQKNRHIERRSKEMSRVLAHVLMSEVDRQWPTRQRAVDPELLYFKYEDLDRVVCGDSSVELEQI